MPRPRGEADWPCGRAALPVELRQQRRGELIPQAGGKQQRARAVARREDARRLRRRRVRAAQPPQRLQLVERRELHLGRGQAGEVARLLAGGQRRTRVLNADPSAR